MPRSYYSVFKAAKLIYGNLTVACVTDVIVSIAELIVARCSQRISR